MGNYKRARTACFNGSLMRLRFAGGGETGDVEPQVIAGADMGLGQLGPWP